MFKLVEYFDRCACIPVLSLRKVVISRFNDATLVLRAVISCDMKSSLLSTCWIQGGSISFEQPSLLDSGMGPGVLVGSSLILLSLTVSTTACVTG